MNRINRLAPVLCALLILFLTACSSKETYRVNCEGFNAKKTEYAPGEKVTVYYDTIGTDTDYSFRAEESDVKLEQHYDQTKGYILSFTMPEHDVTLIVESRSSMMMDPDAHDFTEDPGTAPDPEPRPDPGPGTVEDLYAESIDQKDGPIAKLETNLGYAKVGDCGFSAFLAGGGASSDQEVLAFLTSMLNAPELKFDLPGIGCSTLSAASPDGGHFFGRNFDWSCREVLLLEAHPSDGYASFSTVNVDFIKESASGLSDEAVAMAAYYAPLDGMNEKGLAVSVNMISDSARIAQKSDRPDLTTTTALRLLLDRAATTEEALDLLASYDLHGSYDMMVHFAVADAEGNAVAVEYVDQKMTVTETQVLTNFYVSEGDKLGIGAQQSHERFKVLEAFLEAHPTMNIYELRDAMKAAGEANFDPDPNERTEWTVLYDQTALTATWYRRENFEKGWSGNLR